MKKLMTIGAFSILSISMVALLAWCTVGFVGAVQDMNHYQKQLEVLQEKADNQGYQYIVTEVAGDEINGLAINNRSSDNAGVILSKELDKIDPQVGDIVAVTYGEEFDEILNVEVIQ